ncbi:hypothetical protein KR093_009092 [Drosophila rubida]|uniref:Uncharacterized protein n=1 Tax=Drosophila rubida TaxID=30044 RepID=A0AAD4K1H1_9MUSC|nr:hypothetical protein KR093_009092 [Drosophila rubida]
MKHRIRYIILWFILNLLLFYTIPSQALFTVKKAECTSLDLKHSYFKHCEMRTDAKGQTLLNIYVAMRDKRPINDIIINICLFKIAKNYRMPILNETIDFCAYMGASVMSKMFAFINRHFNKFTNANHSCPYQHDIIYYGVDKERFLSEIPAPKGNYVLLMRVGTNQKWKADVKFYAVKH